MCFIIWRNNISPYTVLQSSWLTCVYAKSRMKSSRLPGGALCTDTHLQKPNPIGCVPGPRPLTEVCEANLKEVKAETRGHSSPGPCLKPKGKASGITRKYSKARQPDLTVEMRGKESVRRIQLGEIRVSDWVCIIYKYLTLGETVPFLQVSCVLLLQKGMQHTRPKSPLSDLEWQQ